MQEVYVTEQATSGGAHSQEFSSSDFRFASLPTPASNLSDLAPTTSRTSRFLSMEMPSCMYSSP